MANDLLSSLVRAAGRAAIAATLIVGAPTLAKGDIPDPLDGIVFGASKRPIDQSMVNGQAFHSIATHSDLPYLLWPAEGAAGALPAADADALAAWLARADADLGFEGFAPSFTERFAWHENDVWSFELVRDGALLHDARLLVHFHGGRFVGLVNHTSGRIAEVEQFGATPRRARVYYAVPAEGGLYRAVAATAQRSRAVDREYLRIVGPDGETLETECTPDPTVGHRQDDPVFTEYPIPNGSFPDQISVDPDGIVWLSDPNVNKVVEFDPLIEQFTMHDTTGGSGPDGLIVGTAGRVWTGMYYSGALGLFNSNTNTFIEYDAPYGAAAMAIPVETSDGKVWVTDHQYNRISEFDPSTNTWIKSVVMPIPSCWVVQGHEDTDRGDIYFTEYNSNRLGRIALGGNTVTDIPTPGGGPAFCVYSDGKVYYSRWTESGIGVLDIQSGLVTEYEFPVANEPGGPLWLRPGGDIVCGTRNLGYIMVFHVATESFSALRIPTSSPGLKDGLTVGHDDVIWFTETGRNKLGKLEFCISTCIADFNGDGVVNTLDVLEFLNAWVDGDPEADINGDGSVNTLDVLEFLNAWTAGC